MAIELPLETLETIDDPSVLLPVHPFRAEDREVIQQWIDARGGVKPEPITDYIIYQHDGNIPPSKDWTAVTLQIAHRKVVSLAQRSKVPITRLGLTKDGSFTQESLRTPIIEYAKDFEYRNRPRIAAMLAKLGPEAKRLKGPLIWRTKSWWYFVTYGREFFNWCERRGIRPRGSNPFAGVSRPAVKQISQTFIVEQWFHRMMAATMSPKEGAIIMLLANGLRADEVIQLKISDLSMQDKSVRVLGKGSKLRTVTLYDRAIRALDRYLTWRRMDDRPWLFPNRNNTNRPTISRTPLKIVHSVACRVFDDPAIIARLSPHKFRHFFISDWMHRGGNPTACKLQVGHCSVRMLERYTHMDPAWVSDEAMRMDPDLSPEAKHALATALLSRMYPPLEPIQLDAERTERERKRVEREQNRKPWQEPRPDLNPAAIAEVYRRHLEQRR